MRRAKPIRDGSGHMPATRSASTSRESAPRVDIVFPRLPPALDGIGDYTARFAECLASRCDVRILTAQQDAAPIPNVRICPAFSIDAPRGVKSLLGAVRADPPDWLLLQFNQFSYGRWGFNPHLPLTIRRIASQVSQTRIAWMAHEDFVPPTSLRWAIMTTWQRLQFWGLGRAADLIFFSIEPWARRYASWFPDTPVHHLPVGSNIPACAIDRRAAREQLGFDDDQFVAGIFGTLRGSRPMPFLERAIAALDAAHPNLTVLYVGPDGTQLTTRRLEGVHVRNAGRLPAKDVSVHLNAMDLHLAPFSDGVSTRRGSFMAGLQHGVPTVSTQGKLTDPMLAARDGEAFTLASTDNADAFAQAAVTLMQNASQRVRMGKAGKRLYEEAFAFDVVAEEFFDTLYQYDLG